MFYAVWCVMGYLRYQHIWKCLAETVPKLLKKEKEIKQNKVNKLVPRANWKAMKRPWLSNVLSAWFVIRCLQCVTILANIFGNIKPKIFERAQWQSSSNQVFRWMLPRSRSSILTTCIIRTNMKCTLHDFGQVMNFSDKFYYRLSTLLLRVMLSNTRNPCLE